MATESHDEVSTTVAMIMKDHATQRSTPDSATPNPVNGRSHSRQTETDYPIWIRYWTGPARFMATLTNQLIIPTEAVGSSSRPASSTPNTRGGGRPVIATTKRLTNQILGVRSNFPPK